MGKLVDSENMKLFLLLLASLGSASAVVTCVECHDAAVGLNARLTSDTSIAEQTNVLIAAVCPMAEDAAMCKGGLSTWWGAMAKCLYPHFILDSEVCIALGYCGEQSALPQSSEWTCEACTDTMQSVAAMIKVPETISEGVSWLQGECFCGQPGHQAGCPDLVSQLLPPAIEVLSDVLIETSPEICRDVVGVC